MRLINLRLSNSAATVILLLSVGVHAHELRQTHLRSLSDLDMHPLFKDDPMTLSQFWRSKMVAAGVLAGSGPARFGLPLASFGPAGAKLMVTSMPIAGNSSRAHRPMLVLTKKID